MYILGFLQQKVKFFLKIHAFFTKKVWFFCTKHLNLPFPKGEDRRTVDFRFGGGRYTSSSSEREKTTVFFIMTSFWSEKTQSFLS